MFLLSAAPGSRGAKKVLESAVIDMGRKGGDIVAVFSLPSLWENFNENDGITEPNLKNSFEEQVSRFRKALFNNISTVKIENWSYNNQPETPNCLNTMINSWLMVSIEIRSVNVNSAT